MSCKEDNRPPTCVILSPSHNSTFSVGDTILVEILANDPEGNLEEVRFYLNGTHIETANTTRFQLITNELLPDDYTIGIVAIDIAGLEDSDEIDISVEASKPVVNTISVDSIKYSSAIITGGV